MPLSAPKVVVVARDGGAGGAQAVAVALALPLGGCEVALVLEGPARELALSGAVPGGGRAGGAGEQMAALLEDDGVEVAVRADLAADADLVSRLRPGVLVWSQQVVEERCRAARHWLVI